MLRHARELLVIAERIDIAGDQPIRLTAIESAADVWVREQRRRQRIEDVQWSRKLFVQTATNWLRFLGRLELPKPPVVPLADRLADFAVYRRDERGLSPVTIRGQSWHIEKFWIWLEKQNCTFDEVSLEHVDGFLQWTGEQGWGRVSVATSAKALRAFFRHAGMRGWCAESIAAGIDSPRMFQHEGLPAGPPWPEVQRLIASTVGDRPQDIRDRAILMLFATYGLRSGEVAHLSLEDLNWDGEIVSIARLKTRRVQQFPLVSEVGEAILRYLQQVRPRSTRREIFLTLKAPFADSRRELYTISSADVWGHSESLCLAADRTR